VLIFVQTDVVSDAMDFAILAVEVTGSVMIAAE